QPGVQNSHITTQRCNESGKQGVCVHRSLFALENLADWLKVGRSPFSLHQRESRTNEAVTNEERDDDVFVVLPPFGVARARTSAPHLASVDPSVLQGGNRVC
ncbi:unnamed protein product, partial [Ectocarpus sp. 12 AP-2014]